MAASQVSAVGGGSAAGNLIQKYSDVAVALAIVTIVIMMIIPLPTALLDVLICLNITIALVVVMSAIYNSEALDLSVFPSLLLVTTLFRLALNISSTRLILLDGFAGEVITAFGSSSSSSSSPKARSVWLRYLPASPWMLCRVSRWPLTRI